MVKGSSALGSPRNEFTDQSQCNSFSATRFFQKPQPSFAFHARQSLWQWVK
jgi:hypothetical protein